MVALGEQLERVISLGKKIDPALVAEDYLQSEGVRQWNEQGASLLLPFAAPIIHMARMAVWAEHRRGPTLVKLPRVGQKELFMQLKIRSMSAGTEEEPHRLEQKSKDDDRITRVGRILRATSIDELVQIVNVRNGHMYMVGARPEAPEEHALHSFLDSGFGRSYACGPPGITGLEQTSGRGELTPAEKIYCIGQYANGACRDWDMEILWATFKGVITRKGAF